MLPLDQLGSRLGHRPQEGHSFKQITFLKKMQLRKPIEHPLNGPVHRHQAAQKLTVTFLFIYLFDVYPALPTDGLRVANNIKKYIKITETYNQ